jgi:hypothetical protein
MHAFGKWLLTYSDRWEVVMSIRIEAWDHERWTELARDGEKWRNTILVMLDLWVQLDF